MVADLAVPAERRGIGEGDVVANLTVVADMSIGHEVSAVADLGRAEAILGSDVHRHRLADLAIGADDEAGRSAAVSHRLRRRPKRGKGVDDSSRTNRGVAGHMDLGGKTAARGDRHMRPDHAIGANDYVRADVGSGVDHGARMNVRHDGKPTCWRSWPRARPPPPARRRPWPRRETTTSICGG